MLPFPAANDDANLESSPQERETLPPPTIPMSRTSEVRMRVNHLNDIVDLVTADLQLDPRSEDFIGGPEQVPVPRPRMALPPKPLCSLPCAPRDLPHGPLASATYFTKPRSDVSEARHMPSVPVRLKKVRTAKKSA